MMRCDSVRSRLDLLADGELENRNTMRMTLEHVARCDCCRQELARITALKKGIHRHMQIDAGPEFIVNLLERMESEEIRPQGPAVREARLAKGFAAAAGIAAAAVIALSLHLLSPADSTRIPSFMVQKLSSGDIAFLSDGMMLYDTVEYR